MKCNTCGVEVGLPRWVIENPEETTYFCSPFHANDYLDKHKIYPVILRTEVKNASDMDSTKD